MRLGLLASHPIQYHSPWFRALARQVNLTVFYAHRQTRQQQAQAGFGVAFDWDVDLLAGYHHLFLNNQAGEPGVTSFAGCDVPEIGSRISTGEFDAFIVMGWNLKCYRQAMRACRRAAVPVLVRGDSHLRTPRSLLKRLGIQIRQRWLFARFDGFLCVGQRHREYLQHFGVSPDRIFSAPHFVDNEWFGHRAGEADLHKQTTRDGWRAAATDLVVLFVGKFQPLKRPIDILRAIALLPPGAQRFISVFVGAGELESELRAEAGRLHSEAFFPGFHNQTKLPGIYAAADVLVLPSASETWGLVVNEAMACGLPSIVSDSVGCAPDLITDGETGFTYPTGDVASLARRLLDFSEAKHGGHDFASAVSRRIARYSVETAVRGTLEAAQVSGKSKRADEE